MLLDLPIVGIGASAGGVEALVEFFKSVPADNALAYVVVTHLAPDHESVLAEILGRATGMPVADAADGAAVEAEHVYVLPAGAVLTIRQGRLRLRRLGAANRERAPIDIFFTSLAEDQAERAIGVVLSGGGTDGTLGLKAIKENGGLTVAQGVDTTRPRFPEMPANAVGSGFVDLLLPVQEIPERILAYVRDWSGFDAGQPEDALSEVHALLYQRAGHDFSEYRDRTFQRRLQRRMQVVQTTKLEEYVKRLRQDPDEVDALFRDLLIGVTSFFRDAAAFSALETQVIPKLFENKRAGDEVRVWVCGCATGEEAYSIAILLREHIGTLATPPKVQIFATDIDEAALGAARLGRYMPQLVEEVSPERLTRFFVDETGGYRVTSVLRDMCTFSPQSVIRDPPYSRLDLISCRNVLIYMKPELQAQVVPVFHFALQPGGCLFLGQSENISRHSELFRPLDRKNRIFQRRDVAVRNAVALRQFLPRQQKGDSAVAASPKPLLPRSDPLQKVVDTILERFAPAHVIVDEANEALFFSAGTGKYLEPAEGPASRDIIAMARPGLRGELRAALHRAKETGQRAARECIAVQINGGAQLIGLAVEPIVEGDETLYAVVFIDHGPMRTQDENDSAQRAGEGATVQQIEKELRETGDRLHSTIEELEAANEEFRSANEDLLSVNEELQSTNEEHETSKEELQSLNEELQTVNGELNYKIDELDRVNSDLSNLFQSTQIATIFLDRELRIRNFTPSITRIFNLIPGDRGRPLSDIASRIGYPNLETDMRGVFGGGALTERSVSLADGQVHYLARVHPYFDKSGGIEGVSLSFVDITGLVAAEEHQKVLTGELSHRVKNTLAVVSSIAERTMPHGQVKSDLIGRFHALGHTHDLLADAGWAEARLRDVIRAELAPYVAADGANLTINGPPVMLKPQSALFLALVMHELATNAAKHGALSVEGGRIDIDWKIAGYSPPHLELTWTEHGGPKIERLTKRGFGMELIERGLRFELQGETSVEVVDGSLRCRMIIPADSERIVFVSPSEQTEREEAAS
ncbi:MAG TPA: CheR family methyltransferase [Stellaceae bacterium]|jgi:two-component system CheB/CheR fusion protein